MWNLMVFPSLGNHLSRVSMLRKNSLTSGVFGMIGSRKRLRRSIKETSKEVVMRTWSLSTRQGWEKEMVLTRRVTMMDDNHSQGRRRT
jgi:hypothetical protein